MRRVFLTLGVALSGCLLSTVREEPRAIEWVPAAVTSEAIELDLEGHGSWLEAPGLGRVWQPAVAYVGTDFYPYGSGGRWVLTEAGWAFDSDYPFGWATFHYGRWSLEPAYGWVWIPGNTWAPSWVAWRGGGEHVGWAPLGPRGVPPVAASRWVFIERGHLGAMNPQRGAVSARAFEGAARTTRPLEGALARQGPSAAFVTACTRQVLTPRPMSSLPSAGRALPLAPSWRVVPQPAASAPRTAEYLRPQRPQRY